MRDWLIFGLTVVGCGIALGQFPRGHPVVPALSFGGSQEQAAPPQAISTGFSVRTIRLGGATTAKLGSTYRLKGRTGTVNLARVLGTVVLRGRWGRGGWIALSKTSTDRQGRFSLKIPLRQRGSLHLRLSMPDGYVGIQTLRVY